MAVDEINAVGGVLGRPLESCFEDERRGGWIPGLMEQSPVRRPVAGNLTP